MKTVLLTYTDIPLFSIALLKASEILILQQTTYWKQYIDRDKFRWHRKALIKIAVN